MSKNKNEKTEVEIKDQKAKQVNLPGIKNGGNPVKVTCTSVSRSMIRDGKSNAEVWEVIKKQFNLDDKKKGYPAWYRMDLRRKGETIPDSPKVPRTKKSDVVDNGLGI